MRKLCYISRFGDPYPLLPRRGNLRGATRIYTPTCSLSSSNTSSPSYESRPTKREGMFVSRRGKSVLDRRSDEKSETLSFPRWQAVNERPPLSLSVLSMHWRLGPRVTIITRCTHACPTLRDRGANQLLYLLPYLFDPARRIPPR